MLQFKNLSNLKKQEIFLSGKLDENWNSNFDLHFL